MQFISYIIKQIHDLIEVNPQLILKKWDLIPNGLSPTVGFIGYNLTLIFWQKTKKHKLTHESTIYLDQGNITKQIADVITDLNEKLGKGEPDVVSTHN
jgi:hypothetical protein